MKQKHNTSRIQADIAQTKGALDPEIYVRREQLAGAIELLKQQLEISHKSGSDVDFANLTIALKALRWIEQGHDPRSYFGIKKSGPRPPSPVSRPQAKAVLMRAAAAYFAKLRQQNPDALKKAHHSLVSEATGLPDSDVRQAIKSFGGAAAGRKVSFEAVLASVERARALYDLYLASLLNQS